ncbi:endonuclease/exonuclease/phosphatase family protein [Methylocystis heyeri]|uniref:Endonuclease/exonuclease/phosphatase family protein n=1 Tax=Methylocystis heyeri TaxID=391905 RepID=A0A6B8KII4_9HYPH|nr:endonuclease/exonuclease/phosphatase family protein [Methylocystis heyeri]QGM47482.1 endonuclease/exonuclease/phosphatase family protein [Methylocystis heyeri]
MQAEFRVATFNLENLEWTPTGEEAFARRKAVLDPMLRELDADVLCLQEIGAHRPSAHAPRRFTALDRLLSGGPYENYHRAASTRPGGPFPADVHNLVILSRFPILERRQIHHDIVPRQSWRPPHEGGPEPEPVEIAFDRPLLYACIALPNETRLHVIDLHLRAPRPAPVPGALGARAVAEGQFLAAQKREGQALEARLFAETLFDLEADARIVVCGDFNADEHDAPTRILAGEGKDEAHLFRPMEEFVPQEKRYSVIHAGRPTLIDHVLASRSLARTCAGAFLLNRGLEDEVYAPEPIVGSLHAPLVASFRLEPTEGPWRLELGPNGPAGLARFG